DTFDLDPVAPVSAVITQHGWRAVHIIDDNVDVPIVVEVSESAAACEVLRTDCAADFSRNILKTPVAEVTIKDFRLLVADVQFSVFDLRIYVAVGEKKILPPVVIEIQKADAEAKIFSIHAKASLNADILKRAISIVVIERSNLLGEVGSRDIEPSITIIVSDSDTHARKCDSILIQCTARRNRDFAECSIVIVTIKQARCAVARYVNVWPAVIVKIRCRSAHAVRPRCPPIVANKQH